MPALKRGTLVFLILTTSPVRGLRPVRAARAAFSEQNRTVEHYQYTDTPQGSFWCTARVLPGGDFAISVGVPFAHVKWFEGRESPIRSQSRCPDPSCCRTAPDDLAAIPQ